MINKKENKINEALFQIFFNDSFVVSALFFMLTCIQKLSIATVTKQPSTMKNRME